MSIQKIILVLTIIMEKRFTGISLEQTKLIQQNSGNGELSNQEHFYVHFCSSVHNCFCFSYALKRSCFFRSISQNVLRNTVKPVLSGHRHKRTVGKTPNVCSHIYHKGLC